MTETSKSPRKEEFKRHPCSINYDMHKKSKGVKGRVGGGRFLITF